MQHYGSMYTSQKQADSKLHVSSFMSTPVQSSLTVVSIYKGQNISVKRTGFKKTVLTVGWNQRDGAQDRGDMDPVIGN